MDKWTVTIHTLVTANNRGEAWNIVQKICETQLKDAAHVVAVGLEPVQEPDTRIAVND